MNYVHMQTSTPMTVPVGDTWGTPVDVKGVSVMLTATAPDGSTINIGNTTSDKYGYFQLSWTPPNTGDYKIQATFAGSESYWSSTGETGITVAASSASPSVPSTQTSPAQSPTTSSSAGTSPSQSSSASPSVSSSPSVAPPPSTESAPSMTLYIAIAAVAIIVAVIAAVLFLRRK
jgi:hypothetical protein